MTYGLGHVSGDVSSRFFLAFAFRPVVRLLGQTPLLFFIVASADANGSLDLVSIYIPFAKSGLFVVSVFVVLCTFFPFGFPCWKFSTLSDTPPFYRLVSARRLVLVSPRFFFSGREVGVDVDLFAFRGTVFVCSLSFPPTCFFCSRLNRFFLAKTSDHLQLP